MLIRIPFNHTRRSDPFRKVTHATHLLPRANYTVPALYLVKGSLLSSSLLKRSNDVLTTWLPPPPRGALVLDVSATKEVLANGLGQAATASVVHTDCGSTHSQLDLCCKTNSALDYFLKKRKEMEWLVYCDDDMYVLVDHVDALLSHMIDSGVRPSQGSEYGSIYRNVVVV